MQPIRRQQLVQAALKIIRKNGLAGATMASVASTAGLSTGIVAHYFGNKDALLEATMRQVLRDLGDAVARQRARARSDHPRDQLRAIVNGNFDTSQISPEAMRIWLSFWAESMNHPKLRRLQRANDRRLHSNLAFHFRKRLPRDAAHMAAAGLAALIDGLWLRGSLTGRPFDLTEALALAYGYIEQCLPDENEPALQTSTAGKDMR